MKRCPPTSARSAPQGSWPRTPRVRPSSQRLVSRPPTTPAPNATTPNARNVSRAEPMSSAGLPQSSHMHARPTSANPRSSSNVFHVQRRQHEHSFGFGLLGREGDPNNAIRNDGDPGAKSDDDYSFGSDEIQDPAGEEDGDGQVMADKMQTLDEITTEVRKFYIDTVRKGEREKTKALKMEQELSARKTWQVRRLQEQVNTMDAKQEELNRRIARLSQNLDSELKEREELENKLSALDQCVHNERTNHEAEVERLKEDLEQKTKEVAEHVDEGKKSAKVLESVSNELEHLQARYDEVLEMRDTLATKNEDLKQENQKLGDILKDTKEKHASSSAEWCMENKKLSQQITKYEEAKSVAKREQLEFEKACKEGLNNQRSTISSYLKVLSPVLKEQRLNSLAVRRPNATEDQCEVRTQSVEATSCNQIKTVISSNDELIKATLLAAAQREIDLTKHAAALSRFFMKMKSLQVETRPRFTPDVSGTVDKAHRDLAGMKEKMSGVQSVLSKVEEEHGKELAHFQESFTRMEQKVRKAHSALSMREDELHHLREEMEQRKVDSERKEQRLMEMEESLKVMEQDAQNSRELCRAEQERYHAEQDRNTKLQQKASSMEQKWKDEALEKEKVTGELLKKAEELKEMEYNLEGSAATWEQKFAENEEEMTGLQGKLDTTRKELRRSEEEIIVLKEKLHELEKKPAICNLRGQDRGLGKRKRENDTGIANKNDAGGTAPGPRTRASRKCEPHGEKNKPASDDVEAEPFTKATTKRQKQGRSVTLPPSQDTAAKFQKPKGKSTRAPSLGKMNTTHGAHRHKWTRKRQISETSDEEFEPSNSSSGVKDCFDVDSF